MPEADAAALVAALRATGDTVAVAESCTGGGVVAALTAVPGASACVWGGLVVYSDQAKIGLAGLSAGDIAAHGAVSEATTRDLAAAARRLAGSTYGAAVTGWAGPTGDGGERDPVGTVYVAVASGDGCECRRAVYDGDRRQVRARAVEAVITALLDTHRKDYGSCMP